MEIDSRLTENTRSLEFDPRLSLLFVVTGIIGIFAAGNWLQLMLLAGIALALLVRFGALPAFYRRLRWLRWFLLSVVVLHLLLSPGHTLFGTAWLSFDGLMRGLMVVSQIVVAMAASLILTCVASPEKLAGAAAALFRPLRILGVDGDRFAGQILLALYFVPILKEEVALASAQAPAASNRLGRTRFMVDKLIESLVRRGDDLACAATTGETRLPELEHLPPFWPPALNAWFMLGASLVVVLIYFGM